MRKVALIIAFLFIPAFSLASTYGSNEFTGGTVSCDVEDNPTYYACTFSVDANTSTWWMTTKTPNPHWWKYQLAADARINKLHIYIRNDGDGAQLKGFDVQGSQNDSSWDTLGSFEAANSASGYQDFIFDDNGTEYAYYRIANTTNTWNTGEGGSNNVYIALMEVEGMTCTDCDYTPTSTPTSTLSTSTLTAAEQRDTYLFLILDALWFFLCFLAVVIAFKYIFDIK